MLPAFTPPAIVQPVEAEYQPTEADRREQGRHFAMTEALIHWPELATLIQIARMLPEFVGSLSRSTVTRSRRPCRCGRQRRRSNPPGACARHRIRGW